MERKGTKKLYWRELLDVVWPYLLTVAILLALFAAGLVTGYHIIFRNAAATAKKRLSELSDEIYGRIVCYTKICDLLAANSDVLSFFEVPPEDDAACRTAVVYLRRELQNVTEIANVPISDIVVYYPDQQAFVSMDGSFIGEKACAARFESQFQGSVTPQSLREIPEDNLWGIFYSGERGWIVRHLYSERKEEAYILLEYELARLVPLSDGEGIVLMGDDSSIVYSSAGDIDAALYRSIRRSLSGNSEFVFGGETYVTFRSVFSLMRCDIMIALSVNRIVADMASFRRLLFALAGACLASIAAICCVVYRRIILPYRYLVEATGTGGGRKSFHDIVSVARTNLLSLQSQQEAAEQERRYLIPLGVGELLQQLYYSPQEHGKSMAQRCLSLAGIRPGQRYFLFALFHMEDPQRTFESMRREHQQVTSMFVLDNLLRDLLFFNRVGIIAKVRRCYYVITTCLEGDTEQEINGIIEQLSQFYKEHYAVTLAATQPLFGDSAEELQGLVRKTMDDADYLSFWHKEQLDTTPTWELESFTSYFKAMRNLIHRLDTQDYEGAQVIFQQIMDRQLPQGVHELQVTRYRIYGMIEMLIAALSEQADPEDAASKGMDYERSLHGVDNISDFRAETERIFAEIINMRRQSSPENGGARQMEKIRAYIDAHYADNSLTVTSVAEHFDISVPYLSREFKRIIGSNMLDYIQKLRVSQAKKLLKDYPVKDVAQQTGFWDVQTFVRVFKKYEGITPREYKTMLSA